MTKTILSKPKVALTDDDNGIDGIDAEDVVDESQEDENNEVWIRCDGEAEVAARSASQRIAKDTSTHGSAGRIITTARPKISQKSKKARY